MDEKYGIEREQEALAQLDKIRNEFAQSRAESAQGTGSSGASRKDKVLVANDDDVLALFAGASSLPPDRSAKPDASAASSAAVGAAAATGIAAASGASKGASSVQADTTAAYTAKPVSPQPSASGAAAGAAAASAASAGASAAAAPKTVYSPGSAKTVAGASSKGENVKTKKEKSAKKHSKEASAEAQNGGKKRKKKKIGFFRVVFRIILVAIVCALLAGGVVGYFTYKVVKASPPIEPENIYDFLSQNSVLYDADGNVLVNLYKDAEGLRTNVEYKDIPKNLQNAFIAIEDKTFWEHNGFNFVRIAGAVWNSIKSGGATRIGGTSTITQQLARNIFLTDTRLTRSMERKVREAYYTILIERALSKEQIIEAYLNTVYLGFNCSGIKAAAKAYFNKEIGELDLLECAVLASLPYSPVTYSPMKRIAAQDVTNPDELKIISENRYWVIYYNDKIEARAHLVLKQMLEQEKITEAQYNAAVNDSIFAHINPGLNIDTTVETTYFQDFVVSQVLSDLQTKLGLDLQEARDMLYSGGLQIYSSIDPTIQEILDDTYKHPENFQTVKINPNSLKYNALGDILTEDRMRIVYLKKDRVINENNELVLDASDFEWQPNGDLKLFKGKKLNIYRTRVKEGVDIALYVKDLYYFDETNQLYSISGCYIDIPMKYKTRDEDGNGIIYSDYFTDYEDVFKKNDDGSITVSGEFFIVREPIIQPQSAMVVIESSTGLVKGMIGGRNIQGSLLFNRATSPHQTGSSIKPLAVYSTALQIGYDNAKAGKGPVYTAASAIEGAQQVDETGKLWPSNAFGTTGITSLRVGVEQSINTIAVNLYNQLDMLDVVANLENFGISTLVKTGEANDLNPASLALGGLTKGVSPYEMCSAFSTFNNYGVRIEPRCYTKITNAQGDVIIDNTPKETKVLDPEVASLMTNILQGAIDNTVTKVAQISNQPVAGKTGTTTDFNHIWFCGMTPKYSATIWIGCDSSVSLGVYSTEAARIWQIPMEKIGLLDERAAFELRGQFVTVTVDTKTGMLPGAYTPPEETRREIFISGTQPTTTSNKRQRAVVCAKTGYLATPDCPKTGYKNCVVRPGGISWEQYLVNHFGRGGAYWLTTIPDRINDLPDYYCPEHNPNTNTYHVSPLADKKTYAVPKNLEIIKDESKDDD